jgi:predicted small secreted protein
MKKSVITIIISVLCLTACGTIGGAVSGAGHDLESAGNWIKNK